MIEFDRNKDNSHDLSFALAAELLDGDSIEEVDDRRDYGETRFEAIGPVRSLGGRVCVAVYTWRGGSRRIISFRKANDREVRRYRASHP